MVSGAIDTGRTDAKGRKIYRGPQGGVYVKTRRGNKVAPATGKKGGATRRRRSRSPARRARFMGLW